MKTRQKIIVLTPALSEFLVFAAEAGPDYLKKLDAWSVFKIADFDIRAAVEVAASIREAKATGDKKRGSNSTWGKVKFDEQIVAIAKINNAETIYSDDDDLRKHGKRVGIKVCKLVDLPKPEIQNELNFDGVTDAGDKFEEEKRASQDEVA